MNDGNISDKVLAALFYKLCIKNQNIFELLQSYSWGVRPGNLVTKEVFKGFLKEIINNADYAPYGNEKGLSILTQCVVQFFFRMCIKDGVISEILSSYERKTGKVFECAEGSLWIFVELLQLVVDNLPLEDK